MNGTSTAMAASVGSAVPQRVEPRPAHNVDALLENENVNLKALERVFTQVSDLRDRVCGPRPQGAPNDTAADHPTLLGRIAVLQRQANGGLNAINDMLAEISQVV